MKMFVPSLVLVNLISLILDASSNVFESAKPCDANACKLPDCRCMSTNIPGDVNVQDIPQLVLLTFDDAVTVTNFPYYEKAFFNRKNPDGCPVQATYFISHEYTDYSKVHELHSHGHEIALHSVSHEARTSYWDSLSVEGHKAEFGDEIDIISYFANIPREDIKGLRVPFLQLGGNNSFQAIKELGLLYDASWPTQRYINPALWPYTLDYQSDQDCPIGKCPRATLPGVWVQPMVTWVDEKRYTCSMVDACQYIPKDVEGLLNFMIKNFNRHYQSNKAPFGFYVHAAWFTSEIHFEAYLKFLDYLQSLKDVYIVSVSKAVQWTQKPTTISNLKELWPECPKANGKSCTKRMCQLQKGQEYRYMTQCLESCPKIYPWLGNPHGDL